MNKKLNDKYLARMEELKYNDDTEVVHCEADDILCELLEKLGYEKLVKAFYALPKWYS